ncbi:MAG TPA: hypothetical protein PKB11_00325 [Desulfovibrio sp.]|uniref:hypothetical protein n=1 Tax=Desulfovibrio sp. TaxID=885 RepID=UPI002CB585E8|nr:hypothetical protein [Desulfovibrio sp.]HMM37183.1 hypothetical protein [Desulfovibrio sp.]
MDVDGFAAQAARRAALALPAHLLHLLLQVAAGEPLRRPAETPEKAWRVALSKAEEQGFIVLRRSRGRLPLGTLTAQGLEVLAALGVQAKGDLQGDVCEPGKLRATNVSGRQDLLKGDLQGEVQGDRPHNLKSGFKIKALNSREKPAGLSLGLGERQEGEPGARPDPAGGPGEGKGAEFKPAAHPLLVTAQELAQAKASMLKALGPTLAALAAKSQEFGSRLAFWARTGRLPEALALAAEAARQAGPGIPRPLAWIDKALERGSGPKALAAKELAQAQASQEATHLEAAREEERQAAARQAQAPGLTPLGRRALDHILRRPRAERLQ